MSKPPSPAEIFQAIADDAASAELERIDALSAEEVRAELAAHGIAAESDAPSGAHRVPAEAPPASQSGPDVGYAYDPGSASKRGGAGSGRVIPFTSRLRRAARVPFVYVAAAVILAVIIGHYLHLFDKPDIARPLPPDPTHHDPNAPAPKGPTPADLARAAELRESARSECARSAWSECLGSLDQALAIDPAGNDAPEVKELRAQAKAGIARDKSAPEKQRP